MERRHVVTLTGDVDGGRAPVAVRPARVAASVLGKRVDHALVDDLERVTETRHRMDDAIGGGTLFPAVREDLRPVVAIPDNADWLISGQPPSLTRAQQQHANLPRRPFGLLFAAFDFSVTQDSTWWFLEANPNGLWAWLEEAAGVPSLRRLPNFWPRRTRDGAGLTAFGGRARRRAGSGRSAPRASVA